MKYIVLTLIFIGLFSCESKPKPIADSRTNDYALYDQNGDFHRLSRYNDHNAIVLWVQGNGCPIVRNALNDFHEIVQEFGPKGFQFFMLNSNLQDNREKIRAEAEAYNFQVPVLVDSAQLLADELNITLTAEAIVLHPTTREILYRGPINDRLDYEALKDNASRNYLSEALIAVLARKLPKEKQKMAKGCKVTRLSSLEKNETLTYTRDIAPLLIDHCIRCHREGGIAPWAMTDYATITGWSSMMREVLISKRMPPWKADPEVGEFENSFALHDSNARKIMRWIDAGIPAGEGNDPLAALPAYEQSWKYGEPDLIMTLNEETIPADRLIPYRYQDLELGLAKDTWLKGVEIQPGNPKTVHHVVLTNTETNKQSPITNRPARPWTDNYIALAGGVDQATLFPEDTGVFLPKDTKLTMQIHYTPTGKIEKDRTRVGFYFHDSIPKMEFLALSPSNVQFVIPPYAKNAALSIADTINRDIQIHYVVPHMHYRGKSIKMFVELPDGNKQPLISVADYSFNWQWLYKLKEPVFVPKGSRILVEGIYDNSYQNPLNPDPSQELRYGIQSTDEMLIGFFNYTLED
ncbi:MAG: redoxin domain-containing protein [Bacteroidia bacterium]|nr:redoxin domain-containing protein [Bacteroidia bacterium]NNM22457.1 redoxin domain-containing protein [Flavobacteriaceae bacterium]